MREIDCSSLPEDLANVALDAAEDQIERSVTNVNGVQVLHNSKLVILNGDNKQTRELYGELRQTMVSQLLEHLDEHKSDYTKEEFEEYRDGIELRKV